MNKYLTVKLLSKEWEKNLTTRSTLCIWFGNAYTLRANFCVDMYIADYYTFKLASVKGEIQHTSVERYCLDRTVKCEVYNLCLGFFVCLFLL